VTCMVAYNRVMTGDDSGFRKLLPTLRCGETSECVMACTESAIRLCTPTLRISLATWALTVRSLMPSGAPISLFDWPATSISKTSFSRSVKVTGPAGKMGPGAAETRSMNHSQGDRLRGQGLRGRSSVCE